MINHDRERRWRHITKQNSGINSPRVGGECDESEEFPSPYLLDACLFIDNLLKAVMDTGFEITAFRDRTT
jgi:hypothetical protein